MLPAESHCAAVPVTTPAWLRRPAAFRLNKSLLLYCALSRKVVLGEPGANPADWGCKSFQTGARLSDRFGFRYWQEARWKPRTASRPHRPHPPTLSEGGARLAARLKGLVGRSGSTNGGDVNLRRCLRQLWADRYDRNLADLFEVQDEIVDRVARAR
jgi:hypothetical protein